MRKWCLVLLVVLGVTGLTMISSATGPSAPAAPLAAHPSAAPLPNSCTSAPQCSPEVPSNASSHEVLPVALGVLGLSTLLGVLARLVRRRPRGGRLAAGVPVLITHPPR